MIILTYPDTHVDFYSRAFFLENLQLREPFTSNRVPFFKTDYFFTVSLKLVKPSKTELMRTSYLFKQLFSVRPIFQNFDAFVLVSCKLNRRSFFHFFRLVRHFSSLGKEKYFRLLWGSESLVLRLDEPASVFSITSDIFDYHNWSGSLSAVCSFANENRVNYILWINSFCAFLRV